MQLVFLLSKTTWIAWKEI